MSTESDPRWERELLEKLATESLREQRRKRRWGVFFKLIGVVYIGVLISMFFYDYSSEETSSRGRHAALVDLQGVIASDSPASAERMVRSLKSAFENDESVAVIMRINSPGGSPVQAGLINDEMKRLKAKYPEKPLYVVVEEICASGGYYVAAAADKIYVNKASLVGSIGVLMNGFGFVDTMDMLGVERRLITAGTNKGFLDPFTASNPDQVKYAQKMIGEIHEQFIQVVREGRGERLKEDGDTFSGLVWTGERSLELGLADELGSIGSVVRDVIQVEDVIDYTEEDSVAERFAKRFGVSFGQGFQETLFGTKNLLR